MKGKGTHCYLDLRKGAKACGCRGNRIAYLEHNCWVLDPSWLASSILAEAHVQMLCLFGKFFAVVTVGELCVVTNPVTISARKGSKVCVTCGDIAIDRCEPVGRSCRCITGHHAEAIREGSHWLRVVHIVVDRSETQVEKSELAIAANMIDRWLPVPIGIIKLETGSDGIFP